MFLLQVQLPGPIQPPPPPGTAGSLVRNVTNAVNASSNLSYIPSTIYAAGACRDVSLAANRGVNHSFNIVARLFGLR